MFQQDWTPVNIGKGFSPVAPLKGPRGAPPKVTRDDLEVFRHKDIPKELADRIKVARVLKGLSQEALAQAINIRPAVVRDIEACKGPYDHVSINKMLRHLGLTLKH